MLLPGLSAIQEAALKRRGLTTRARLAAHLKKHGEDDPIVRGLPAAARAELVYSPVARIPFKTAVRLGEKLRDSLRITGGPYLGKKRIWVVGSVRRGKADTKDLDMLVVLADKHRGSGRNHLAMIALRPGTTGLTIRHSYASGARRRSFIVGYGGKNYRVDMFLAYDSELPYALYHHTGSSRYNIRIRAHAKTHGWKLNQYGLYDAASGKRVHGSARIKTEKDLAEFLGVTPRAPEDRAR